MSPTAPHGPTPEGILISTARKAAGLKIQQAANATDGAVSATRWSQIETGREPRRGEVVQARASDTLLAHMAAAVGVTAGQLEAAGRRDAALILLEIQRQRRVATVRGRTDPSSSPAEVYASDSGTVTESETVTKREPLQDPGDLGDDIPFSSLKPWEQRLLMITELSPEMRIKILTIARWELREMPAGNPMPADRPTSLADRRQSGPA